MHTKEELDMAIIKLYTDYKESIKKYKKGDTTLINKLIEINKDEKNYTREEVYYIAFNSLLLLQEDIKKGNI